MTKWYVLLLCVVIFLIPSNLFLKLDTSHAYVHGLLVDYLIPKFYLSDIPILAILLLWFKESVDKKRFRDIKNPVALLFALLAVAIFSRGLVSLIPRASLWFFLKLSEMSVFGLFLVMHRSLLNNKKIWWSLFAAVSFQAVVGVLQYHLQSSVFHSYLALGEVDFSKSIGLAKDNYFYTNNILPYGTTAHPNILGGFLALGGILLFDRLLADKTPKNSFVKLCILFFYLFLSYGIFLTQSISAVLCLLGGVAFFVFKKPLTQLAERMTTSLSFTMIAVFLIISLVVSPFFVRLGAQEFPKNPSFTRRNALNQAATAMILQSPVSGVGLDNFTPNLEKNFITNESVRFVQPVHNVGILWVAETGLVGVLIVFLVYYLVKLRLRKNWPKNSTFFLPALIMLPVFSLDHYLLTQQSGLLLGIFFLILFQLSIIESAPEENA